MHDKNKKDLDNKPAEKNTLNRNLGVFQLTMMGAGMMIGAGVFVATGIAIGKSGPGGILLAFALNGLIAIFTAMSFAELCSAMPEAGGAYAQVKKSVRRLHGIYIRLDELVRAFGRGQFVFYNIFKVYASSA